MKTPLEILQEIIEMQKECYGNGMTTHMRLDTLCKEAEEIKKYWTKPERFLNPNSKINHIEKLPVIIYNNKKYRYFTEENVKMLTGSCQCIKDCNCIDQAGKMIIKKKTWYRNKDHDGTNKCFYIIPYK